MKGTNRRRVLPTALAIVASLLAFLAIFALWANRQVLNTDNWTETSSSLLESTAIRTQVATFLVDELYASVDVEARIESALPPRAAPLAGPAAGGLKDLAERGTTELLGRPRPQALWEGANRRAQARLLDVAEGGGDVVSTTDGNVTLDLKALLGATQERVGVGGRAQAGLPDDVAQLTIMKSDDLELAQDVVYLLKVLAAGLVLAALALYGLAILLARGWRREALRAAGIGLAMAGAAALVARSLAGDAVVDALASTSSVKPAAAAAWTIGTSLLNEAAVSTLVNGVVIVLAAWLAGPTRLAVATRGALAPFLREPRYAFGGLAVLVLALVAWSPTAATRRLLPALVLIGLLTAAVAALRRQTNREFPDASFEQLSTRIRTGYASLGGRGANDRLDSLQKLAGLRDSGVLDDAEFEREKARIVGQPGPPDQSASPEPVS